MLEVGPKDNADRPGVQTEVEAVNLTDSDPAEAELLAMANQ